MRRRRGPAVALAASAMTFTVWFLGAAAPAEACSCAVPPDEATRDAGAETIIVGRPTTMTEHEGTEEAPGEVEYTVDVDVLHKGEIPDPVILWTASGNGTCGVSLGVDVLYKLYPRRSDDGRYRINLCDGNRQATQADLEPLGPTTPEPTATTGAPRVTTSTSTPAAAVTTSTIPPFRPSTTTSSTLPLPTVSTLPPTGDQAAVDIDDDDEGIGLLLPAVGALAVVTVGAAALAVRRIRNPVPLAPPPGLAPMRDLGGGRRPRR